MKESLEEIENTLALVDTNAFKNEYNNVTDILFDTDNEYSYFAFNEIIYEIIDGPYDNEIKNSFLRAVDGIKAFMLRATSYEDIVASFEKLQETKKQIIPYEIDLQLAKDIEKAVTGDVSIDYRCEELIERLQELDTNVEKYYPNIDKNVLIDRELRDRLALICDAKERFDLLSIEIRSYQGIHNPYQQPEEPAISEYGLYDVLIHEEYVNSINIQDNIMDIDKNIQALYQEILDTSSEKIL